jgi:hypothetical protein
MRPLLLVALLVSGCQTSAARREPDEYIGCGSDEHWRRFEDTEPHATVDDTRAPSFTAPASGAKLAVSPKTTLSWTQDPSDPGMPEGDVPHVEGPACMNCCPEWNLGALTTLHLPAISGNVYDLQLSVGGQMVHRAITTLQEWGAPDDVWSSFRGKTVSVRIYRLDLLRNDVKEGPFTPSAPFTFSVNPS